MAAVCQWYQWVDRHRRSDGKYLFASIYRAGTFYYRVIATMSAAGCSYAVSPSYTFNVINPATVTVTPANTSLCIGATQILTTNVSGASGTYSILWQESNNNSVWWNVTSTSSATLNTNNDSLELAYFRPVIDFSVCGIYYGNSVQIQTNAIHTVDATITNGTVCVGGSTQLNGIVANTTGTVPISGNLELRFSGLGPM